MITSTLTSKYHVVSFMFPDNGAFLKIGGDVNGVHTMVTYPHLGDGTPLHPCPPTHTHAPRQAHTHTPAHPPPPVRSFIPALAWWLYWSRLVKVSTDNEHYVSQTYVRIYAEWLGIIGFLNTGKWWIIIIRLLLDKIRWLVHFFQCFFHADSGIYCHVNVLFVLLS